MKIKRIIATSLLTLLFVATPVVVVAHEGEESAASAVSQTAQVNQPIEVPKTTTTPIEQNSGFTDENGNPISVEDYNKQRAESTKGAFEKYPVPFALAGILLVGGVGFLVFKKLKK